jgi:uncharacterized membrane protein
MAQPSPDRPRTTVQRAPPAATPSSGQRLLAACAYWGPLVIVPLIAPKKSRFVAFHTRQGVYVFATAVAAFLVTLGLLFAVDRTAGDESPLFLVLSVVLLLEMVVYGVLVLVLTWHTLHSRMTMLPLLGDLAGES